MWYNPNAHEARSNPPWWPSTYVSNKVKQQYLDAGWQEVPNDFILPIEARPAEIDNLEN